MTVILSDEEAEELIRRLRSAEEYLGFLIKLQRAKEWEEQYGNKKSSKE